MIDNDFVASDLDTISCIKIRLDIQIDRNGVAGSEAALDLVLKLIRTEESLERFILKASQSIIVKCPETGPLEDLYTRVVQYRRYCPFSRKPGALTFSAASKDTSYRSRVEAGSNE